MGWSGNSPWYLPFAICSPSFCSHHFFVCLAIETFAWSMWQPWRFPYWRFMYGLLPTRAKTTELCQFSLRLGSPRARRQPWGYREPERTRATHAGDGVLVEQDPPSFWSRQRRYLACWMESKRDQRVTAEGRLHTRGQGEKPQQIGAGASSDIRGDRGEADLPCAGGVTALSPVWGQLSGCRYWATVAHCPGKWR